MKDLVLARGPGVRRVLLLVAAFGAPVIFLWGVTNDPFNVPKLALLTVCIVAAGGLRLLEVALGGARLDVRPLLVPAALIGVPLLLAWLFTPYKGWSLLGQYPRFEGLIPYLLAIGAGFLYAEAFAGRTLALTWTITVAAVVVGLYAVMQAVGLDPFDVPIIEYVGSTVGHSNFMGGFLAISLPLSISLWDSPQKWRARVALAATIVAGVGLVLSFSQGAWGAAVAGVAVYAGIRLADKRRWVRPAALAIAGLIVVVAVGSVVYSLIDPFSPLVGDTTRARGLWWEEAFNMGLDHPLVGRGPSAFAVEGAHYRSAEDALAHANGFADSPHSVPLTFFANAGALGLIGFVLLAAWILLRGIRLPASETVAVAYFAAAVAYLVQSLASLDELLLAFVLWVVLGGLVAARAAPESAAGETSAARVPGRIAAGVTAALLVGVSLPWVVQFFRADVHAHRGHRFFELQRYDAGRREFDKALDLRADFGYRHQYGTNLGIAALLQEEDGGPLLEETRKAFAYLQDFPQVQGLVNFGVRLELYGPFDEDAARAGVAVLRRSLSYDPYNPIARVHAAEGLMQVGDYSAAESLLQNLIPTLERLPEYGENYPEVWAGVAIARIKQGDLAGAEEPFARAEALGERGLPSRSVCYVVVMNVLRDLAEGEEVTRAKASSGLRFCTKASLDLVPPELRPRPLRGDSR